jgi:hypothetical protein
MEFTFKNKTYELVKGNGWNCVECDLHDMQGCAISIANAPFEIAKNTHECEDGGYVWKENRNKSIDRLHEDATRAASGVIERINDARIASAATRIGEFDNLHITAHMDIDRTVESLRPILAYKKKAATEILRFGDVDEEQVVVLNAILKHADNMINQVLRIS